MIVDVLLSANQILKNMGHGRHLGLPHVRVNTRHLGVPNVRVNTRHLGVLGPPHVRVAW